MEKTFCFTYQYTVYKDFYITGENEEGALDALQADFSNAYKEEEAWHNGTLINSEEVS